MEIASRPPRVPLLLSRIPVITKTSIPPLEKENGGFLVDNMAEDGKLRGFSERSGGSGGGPGSYGLRAYVDRTLHPSSVSRLGKQPTSSGSSSSSAPVNHLIIIYKAR